MTGKFPRGGDDVVQRQLCSLLGFAVAVFGVSCSGGSPQDGSKAPGAPTSGTAAALANRETAAPVTLRTVSLQVRSKSWIEGSTFDQEALKKSCSAEQV